jgi:hypothetical protein
MMDVSVIGLHFHSHDQYSLFSSLKKIVPENRPQRKKNPETLKNRNAIFFIPSVKETVVVEQTFIPLWIFDQKKSTIKREEKKKEYISSL